MSKVKEKSSGVIDVYPYSVSQLKADNPNTSFPSNITEETLEGYKVYGVSVDPQPEHSNDKVLAVDAVPTYSDGVWNLGWSINDKSESHLEADRTGKRRERNELLRSTDHYALTDRGLSDDVADYRQALRDFPEETDFPYIDFPEPPEEVLDDLGGQ